MDGNETVHYCSDTYSILQKLKFRHSNTKVERADNRLNPFTSVDKFDQPNHLFQHIIEKLLGFHKRVGCKLSTLILLMNFIILNMKSEGVLWSTTKWYTPSSDENVTSDATGFVLYKNNLEHAFDTLQQFVNDNVINLESTVWSDLVEEIYSQFINTDSQNMQQTSWNDINFWIKELFETLKEYEIKTVKCMLKSCKIIPIKWNTRKSKIISGALTVQLKWHRRFFGIRSLVIFFRILPTD